MEQQMDQRRNQEKLKKKFLRQMTMEIQHTKI